MIQRQQPMFDPSMRDFSKIGCYKELEGKFWRIIGLQEIVRKIFSFKKCNQRYDFRPCELVEKFYDATATV